MSTILDKIIAYKREELKTRKASCPLGKLKNSIEESGWVSTSFYDALKKTERVNIIAEVKKGSPSKGVICHDFDHIAIAADYEAYGAAAISVLTDERFFFGSLAYLKDIKRKASIPILRKDFIVDEYQIFEAKAGGADAVLLIAAVLDTAVISDFLGLTRSLGMAALVEVHNEPELEKALTTGARIIGINNRNLNDFSVELNTTIELAKLLPPDRVVVSESGIHTRADIELVQKSGVNAFLIGEALMRGGDIKTKLGELMNP